MRTEYKRDMNHNYLIVYGENEINTGKDACGKCDSLSSEVQDTGDGWQIFYLF